MLYRRIEWFDDRQIQDRIVIGFDLYRLRLRQNSFPLALQFFP